MAKVTPRIKGPRRDADDAPPAPPMRPRDIPYSVAWFRQQFATYAFGTIVCGAMMVTAAAWMGGSLGAFGQRLGAGFNVLMQHAGLSVEKLVVVGLEPTVEARAIELAGVRVGDNMFGADPYAIRRRVETLESVAGVSVHRLWPDQVTIVADAREPIALWRMDGEWRVIDQKGRAFANVNPDDFLHLPRVEGRDAAEATASLLATMSDYPDLRVRVESARRVSGRRWDVKFDNGPEVALPDDARMGEALAALNLLNAQHRVLDLPVSRVDARHPERFALRPAPGLPAASLTGPAIGGA